jgi:steroid delta-isomerase-like uncharacterized protein
MTMTTEQNKAIVRDFYKAFEANDQARLNELLAPDLVAYSHAGPGPQDRATHLRGIGGWNATFSDTRFAIEDQVAEEDRVATRVILRAAHSGGDFQGFPPTGKQIAVSGISIERIKDGKIGERRGDSDWWGMMQQLGLIPMP